MLFIHYTHLYRELVRVQHSAILTVLATHDINVAGTLSMICSAVAVEIHSLACMPASNHRAGLDLLEEPNWRWGGGGSIIGMY